MRLCTNPLLQHAERGNENESNANYHNSRNRNSDLLCGGHNGLRSYLITGNLYRVSFDRKAHDLYSH